ncbi:MAG: cysteine hydrolase [Lachnospiraceae bacterium]|nr:cysteine hydrolase [Lachnospiraceae bacterium]
MKKALIVVDMQKDFIDGSLGTKEAVAIVPNVIKKIGEYRENGWEIFYTKDTHEENYMNTNEGKHLPVIHCIKGTDGWEIPEEIQVSEGMVIEKNTFGYFNWGVFDLDTVDEIELIGLCTDICVVSNALILKAMFPETRITVDASCCAGVTPESHKAALETMKMCQIEII